MFPTLPIKLIPDVVFLLLLARISIFESDKIAKNILKKSLLIPNMLVLIYLIINFIEVFNPLLPHVLIGLQAFRGVFKIATVFWATLIVLDSQDQIFRFIGFLRINIFIIFIFSFKQLFFGFSDCELTVYCPGAVRRVYSTCGNAAVFSLILGVGVLDLYLKAIYEKRSAYLFLCAAYLVVSALSLHRAPLFATFISLGFLSLLNMKELSRFIAGNIHKIIAFMILSLFVMIILMTANLPAKFSMIRAEFIDRTLEIERGVSSSPSIKTRISQINPAINAIIRYPLGGGLGYTLFRVGNFSDKGYFLDDFNLRGYRIKLPSGTGDNTFLTVLLETGWFGLVFFMVLLVWTIAAASIKAMNVSKYPLSGYIASFSVGTLIIVLFSIMTSSIYFYLIVGSIFWISFGISRFALKGSTAS
jgi:hypothetical protein